ncbi:MAG: hypothetical protein D3909_10245, partial [Candidatus Electrothrix sp. ATG1]|nr:hypothetical protein [Candidatus Electrothrix sp. ATG1]
WDLQLHFFWGFILTLLGVYWSPLYASGIIVTIVKEGLDLWSNVRRGDRRVGRCGWLRHRRGGWGVCLRIRHGVWRGVRYGSRPPLDFRRAAGLVLAA